MARPSKLTDAARDRFVKAIAAGAFPEVAARFAGFSPASLYRYLRGSTPEHAAFREEVIRAQTELEIRLSGTLVQAALSDPRWAMTMLQSRFGERWARRPAAAEDSVDAPALTRRGAQGLVTLDPLSVEALVPRLLAAGQTVRGEPNTVAGDLEGFETRRPGRSLVDAKDRA